MYQQKRRRHGNAKWCGKKKKWRQKKNVSHGYGVYWKRLQEEIKRDDARWKLWCVLGAIAGKKNEEEWNKSNLILRRLEQELIALGEVPSITQSVDVIKYCVSMFEIVSRAQDELDGIFVYEPSEEEKRKAFDEFTYIMYCAGRHDPDDLRDDELCGKVPYWNTSFKGKTVNKNTIKFGPEIGEDSRPAKYWMNLSKKKKATFVCEKDGKVKKITGWKTDLIVQFGVYSLCKNAPIKLLDAINILLS